MKINLLVVTVLAVSVFALGPVAAAKPPASQAHLTACEAVAMAKTLNGKYIAVRGRLYKSMEFTDLTASGCSNAIAVQPTKHAQEDDPGFKAIQSVWACPTFGGTKPKIEGDFVGRFKWNPGSHPACVLLVDRVNHLSIEVNSCGLP